VIIINILPYVTDLTRYGERQIDISSYLLDNRIIWLDEPITDITASAVVQQMMYLESQPGEEISLYINCGGGKIDAGLSIIDFMDRCKCDIKTVCHGICASMASIILSNGTIGKRVIMKNSHVMVHQAKGGAVGQLSDIEVTAEYLSLLNETITRILSKNCRIPIEELKNIMDRDFYMTAAEAVKFGIVDVVLN